MLITDEEGTLNKKSHNEHLIRVNCELKKKRKLFVKKILLKCNDNLKQLACCHTGKSDCNCYECLREGFYGKPDTYDCEKKMNYYVLNYGPSYASEIYHYLCNSKLLEWFSDRKKIKIISLGCGFAPDLIAISKYIDDIQLPLQFEYVGIDKSIYWQNVRYTKENANFIVADVIASLNLKDFDLVIMAKLFSTLYNHKVHDQFLLSFTNAAQKQLKPNSIVVFNDINSHHTGRDVFHNNMKGLFGSCRQFYCANPPYKDYKWIKIPENHIVFPIPINLSIDPLQEIRNNIFFEYRK